MQLKAIITPMTASSQVSTGTMIAIPEIVIDGASVIIIEKQNPQQIADAIIKLIENPDLRIKMGKAARKRYEDNFILAKNINRMIEVFNKVLSED